MKWFNKKSKFNVQGLRRKGTKNKVIAVFAAICLFVFIVALSGKVLLSSLTSSVYNISNLKDNIDNVNAGDIINYEINGYSDWKVLSVDKENGTIEVTSNTNVKDLTIEPYKSVDEYNRLFQSEADRYKDNNYVVSTRTISKADSLLLGDVEEEFWLANVNEISLMTNKSNSDSESIIYTNTSIPLNDFYVIPYITLSKPADNVYPNVGDEISFSSNGIDKWFYSGQTISDDRYGDVMVYLPITPVQLYVYNLDNIGSVSQSYFNSFNTTGILGYGNWLDQYSHNFSDVINLYRGKNVFDNEKKVMYFVAETGRKTTSEDGKYNIMKSYGDKPGVRHYYDSAANGCYEHWENNDYVYCNSYYYLDESEIFMYDTTDQNSANGSKDRSVYYVPKTLSFGYRPVLTLRIDNDGSNNDNNSNENNIEDNRHQINNELEIGNYVKYDANGYKNWRVLSVDVSAGTVDVISGGIVKNIQLYGIDDYENYEIILQNEVDSYKNGDNVVSARALEYDDRENLSKMKDKVYAKYWLTDKRDYNGIVDVKSNYYYNEDETSSKISLEHTFYEVAYMYYDKGEENAITKKYGKLFYTPTGSEKTFYGNSLTFVAGVRPVITLKLDDVELIDSEDVSKLESLYSKLDNKILNEQNEKNSTDSRSSANTGNSSVYSYSTINSINSNGGSSNSSSGSRNSGVTSSTNKSDNKVSGSCGSGCCQVTAKNSIISKGYLRFIFYVLLLIFIVLLLMFACFVFLTNKVSCYIDNKEEKDNDILKAINKDDDSLSKKTNKR